MKPAKAAIEGARGEKIDGEAAAKEDAPSCEKMTSPEHRRNVDSINLRAAHMNELYIKAEN